MIKSKNIPIILVCYPGQSGLTHYSFSLCNALAKLGLNMSFVTNRNAEFEHFLSPQIKCVKLFSRSRFLAFKYIQFVFFLLSFDYKVIHFQSWVKVPVLDYMIIRLLKLLGKKIVFTAHDILPMQSSCSYKVLFRNLYKTVDAIIVHSEESMMALDVLTKCNHGPAFVVPHGVYDIFLPRSPLSPKDISAILRIPDEKKVILFFGSVNERKGIIELLPNIKKLVERDIDIIFIIAGKNSYPQGFLEQKFVEFGIADNVVFINKWVSTRETQVFFTRADCVILPYKESFTSGVLKLAYAFGKPVIAKEIGELPEVIKTDKTGIIVQDEFTNEDVDAVVDLLNNQQRLNELKNNIMIVVERKYSWNKIACETLAIYQKVL